MADIPGFRDALLRSMASRLRTVDARLLARRSDAHGAHTLTTQPQLSSLRRVTFGPSTGRSPERVPARTPQRVP